MSHFRQGFEKAKTTKDILEMAKTIKPEEAAIFVKEGAAFVHEVNEKEGEIRSYTPEMEQRAFKEVICRAAAKESPEVLERMEKLLDFKLPRSPIVSLFSGLGVLVVLSGHAVDEDGTNPNVITVEGRTVNEEPPSGEPPRLLPSKRQ